jgi:hypothetical protein
MWKPITLSRKQCKAMDRVGGAELILPWPPGLPPGPPVYDTRDATPAERRAAEAIVGPACDAADLLLIRTTVARPNAPPVLVPPDAHGGERPQRLIVLIIGRRWVHVGTDRTPAECWYTGAIERA